jgi:hypothetical protein
VLVEHGASRSSTAGGRDGDHVHKDSTVSLGSFIQVLASGRPIGRIFHVNNAYRFSSGEEGQPGEAELQDEDLERLEDEIRTKYQAGGSRAR